MKGAVIFLADGFEDVEAIATADVLRRGGVEVEFVSIGEDPFVVSSHGLTVGVEKSLSDILEEGKAEAVDHRDFLIFPGGMPGTRNLAACKPLIDLMNRHYEAGGSLAAICAAPGLVLSQLKSFPEGCEFTCYDGFEDKLIARGGILKKKPAVNCERIISGRGAGHAVEFGLTILEAIKNHSAAEDVRHGMILDVE